MLCLPKYFDPLLHYCGPPYLTLESRHVRAPSMGSLQSGEEQFFQEAYYQSLLGMQDEHNYSVMNCAQLTKIYIDL